MNFIRLSLVSIFISLACNLSVFAADSSSDNYPLNTIIAAHDDLCVTDGFNHDYAICMDLKDGKMGMAQMSFACVVNPAYQGKIPASVKKICNGDIRNFGPFPDSGSMTIDVTDKYNPHRILMTQVSMSFDVCNKSYQGNDLSYLAGNIYSCDQKAGKFIKH